VQFQRLFSTEALDLEFIRKNYVVRRRGDDGYGSREYLLVPPGATKDQVQQDPSLPAAVLLAHRNIVFGARTSHDFLLQEVCPPLVEKAVHDAGENGEQPQAMASLAGLCNWINVSLETGACEALEQLKANNLTSFEAVQAIATGIPRPGHSVVGEGTYRDAEEGWKAVAIEFVEKDLSEEATLYRQQGARLVAIEHLADRNPDYLASAGGAMARLFFL
jgi:hypothetical protein